MYPQTNQKKIRITAYILLGVTICSIAFYFGQKGFLIISPDSNSKKTSIIHYSDELTATPVSVTGSSNLVQYGVYGVSSLGKNGIYSIQEAKVPSLLRNVRVNKSPDPRMVKTLGRNSLRNIVLSQKGIVSYSGTDTRKIEPLNITNDGLVNNVIQLPSYTDSTQVNPSTVCGIEDVTGGVQPSCYNAETNTRVYFAKIESKRVDITVSKDMSFFSVIDIARKQVFQYRPDGLTTTVELPKDIDFSQSSNGAIFSTSDQYIAIATGKDSRDSSDDRRSIDSDTIKDIPQTISILDIKTGTQVARYSYKDIFATSISLSPNGSFLAVTTANQTAFYATKNPKDNAFISPYITREVLWLSDTKVAITTQDEGIMIVEPLKRLGASLTPPSLIQPTAVSAYDPVRKVLYFTGFTSTIQGSSNPNAYVADLTKSATRLSAKSLSSFPYQGSGFYVDVLGGIATIQLTRYIEGDTSQIDTDVKNQAETYVRTHLGTAGYELRYSYIDAVVF